MALLHRDHTDGRTDTDARTDTVAGPTTTGARPSWPSTGEASAPAERVVRKNSLGHTLRVMLATVLIVAIAAVAIANTDQVDVDLLLETYDAPLSALVGGAAGAGFLVGLLLGWRRRPHA